MQSKVKTGTTIKDIDVVSKKPIYQKDSAPEKEQIKIAYIIVQTSNIFLTKTQGDKAVAKRKGELFKRIKGSTLARLISVTIYKKDQAIFSKLYRTHLYMYMHM